MFLARAGWRVGRPGGPRSVVAAFDVADWLLSRKTQRTRPQRVAAIWLRPQPGL